MAFVTVDLGAGKHPSPLEKKKKKKKKKKLERHLREKKKKKKKKKKKFCDFLPAPIYKRLYVRDDIHIDIDRYEFFCGHGVRVPQAAFYKIER